MSKPPCSSSGSDPTDASGPGARAVEELGRKLLDELRGEPSSEMDTPTRWMAHRLAELMLRAEQASPEDREAASNACRDTILLLWQHRAHLPRGRRPLEKFDAVFATLRSLRDPHGWWYDRDQPPGGSGTFLQVARALDTGAKAAIRTCLALAAAEPAEVEATWLDAAVASISADVPDVQVARDLADDAALLAGTHPEGLRAEAMHRVQRLRRDLEALQEAARILLQTLPQTPENEDDE